MAITGLHPDGGVLEEGVVRRGAEQVERPEVGSGKGLERWQSLPVTMSWKKSERLRMEIMSLPLALSALVTVPTVARTATRLSQHSPALRHSAVKPASLPAISLSPSLANSTSSAKKASSLPWPQSSGQPDIP